MKEEISTQDPHSLEQMQQMLCELKEQKINLDLQIEGLHRTRHELEASRDHYFRQFELAPVGYLILNNQGQILDANLNARTLLGLSQFVPLKQQLTDFFLPEDLDIYRRQREYLLDPDRTQSWDLRIITSAGFTFWAHLQAVPGQNGECRITLEDITKRKQDEYIMSAGLRLSEYADSHTLDELITNVLNEAEILTGSTVGFFHFLEPDQVTLTLQSWSTNTVRTMCTAEGKGQHYSVDKAGVWVECIHTGKPVIHNNYAGLQNRKGLPEGHAPVQRELVVPVFRDNLIVGIIGVGNKSNDYTEQDIEAVSRLINFTWDSIIAKQSEEELNLFFDLIPDMVCIASTDGYFKKINKTWETVLGYSKEELMSQPFMEFIHPDDRSRTYEVFEKQLAGEYAIGFVNRYRCKDGMYRWIEWMSVPAVNNKLFAAARDITDRKLAEQKINDNMNYIQTLMKTAPVGISTYKASGEIVSTNLKTAHIVGMPIDELMQHNFRSSETWKRYGLLEIADRTLSTGEVQRIDRDVVTINGKHVNIETIFVPFMFGGEQQLMIMLVDITERKRAEVALQSASIYTRSLIESSLDPLLAISPDGMITDVNEASVRVTGVSREHLIGSDFSSYFTDSEKAREGYRRVLSDGTVHDYPLSIRHISGYLTEVLCNASIYKDELGNIKGVFAAARDVTELRKASEALRKAHDELETRVAERTSELAHAMEQIRKSEERHQLATAVAKEAIWEVDFVTGSSWWNRAYSEIFNRPPDEHHAGEWWLHQIHPNDRERINGKFSRTVSEGPDEWADTYRMKKADGSYAFIQDRAIIVRDGTGTAIRAVGAKLDITKQLEAEEAVRESEERLHFALETIHTGAWDLDLGSHNAFHSFEHDRIFGYTEPVPIWTYEMFIEHVLSEDRAMVNEKFRKAIESRNDWNFECRIRRTDGQVRWVYAAGRFRKDTAGTPHRMAGIIQDITERKQIEEEILMLNAELEKRVAERTAELAHANEQLMLSINEWVNTFNASTDPIMILDCNCRIRRANSAMAALLGLQIEECVGKFCYEYVHHTEGPIQQCPHSQMLQDAQPHTEEVFEEHIGKHLLVTVSPLFDADGILTGSMHYAKDITSIKEAEQVLANAKNDLERMVTERTSELALANEKMKKVSFELAWAEEKERERIAGELHDQVGQSLLLAKMKLDALSDSISSDSLRSSAEVASSLIESSIHDIRSLTFRMRPPILNTAGIETALKWLCSSINSDYNLRVDFTDDCRPKPLPAEVRYSLYQAVRELLLNVVKHAGTDQAQLSIKTENNVFVILVADKGVGFNHSDAILKHVDDGGYGLFNVQQRIEQMGGRFAVESALGTGTTVTVWVPLNGS